ncbi:MAG: PQQ-binding-like beta-propeller repeat protein [Methanoregula sp.]|nr:PQQ-binding-like beta-propeller repeat protein [Methanoregula sp.]
MDSYPSEVKGPADPVGKFPTDSPVPVWSDQIGKYSSKVDCSGDGAYVLAGSDKGIVRMYNSDGKILWTYHDPEKSVMAVSITRSGEYGAAALYDPYVPSDNAGGEILFFNNRGEILWKYNTGSTVHRLDLSSDGDTLFASGDTIFYSFNNSGKLLGMNKTKSTIWAAAASGDGTMGIAGTGLHDNRIIAMDRDGTVIWNYPTETYVRAVDISETGDVFVGTERYRLSWLNRNGTPVWQFNSSPPFTDVAISADGRYCVASSQYFLRFFNNTGTQLWRYEDNGYVNSVAISRNGDYIIGGSEYATLLFDKSGHIIWKYPTGTTHVSASEDGMYFAASSSYDVYFFNREGSKKVMAAPTTDRSNNPDNVSVITSSPVTAPAKSTLLSLSGIISAIICAIAIVITRKKRQ